MRRWLVRASGVGVASLMVTAALTLLPRPGAALAGGAALTIKSSRSSVITGGTVTVSGTLTDNGQPVAGSEIQLSIDDPANSDVKQVQTDTSGDWSAAVKIALTTTVTATALYLPANNAKVTITAIARATLKLAASIARPYLLDPATVTTAPAGWVSYRLQVRQPGTTVWQTVPDTKGVWAPKPGTLYVRAVATAPGFAAAGVSPQVTVTIRNGTVPRWIRELNALRTLNNAPLVVEDASLSYADSLHVRYMEKTGSYSHYEDPKSAWYTKLGAQAGMSSDLFLGAPDPIAGWATAPYHALAELARASTRAGYATGGGYAALWVDQDTSLRHLSGPAYQFPGNNKTTSLRTYYVGGEIPDPLAGCPQAWRDRMNAFESVGLPIIFGDQSAVSRPTATVSTGGKPLRVCVVSAGIYGDAVFVIPLLPLQTRHTYTVAVSYRGKLQSRWQFRTS